MISPDRHEIMFAGAGILWGATTFFRGVHVWRSESSRHLAHKNTAVTFSVVGGFALAIGCSAYLAWSVQDVFHP